MNPKEGEILQENSNKQQTRNVRNHERSVTLQRRLGFIPKILDISFKCFCAPESVKGTHCCLYLAMNKGSLGSAGNRAIIFCKAVIGHMVELPNFGIAMV